MGSDIRSTATIDGSPGGSDWSTTINALVGGVAGVVLSFVPLSPVLGGAIAGYLEGGDSVDGVKAGALAGLVMLVPFLFFGTIVAVLVLGISHGGAPFAFLLIGAFVFLIGALYTVGLSVLGGFLGVVLENEL